ncbi:MAG: FtsX-like permease family protein [Dehalococcoidales bacterium]|nr:FtsX-like permease family protein [Dehalococcoidales bacterium]
MGNLKLALFLAFKSIIRGNRWAFIMIILMMSLSFANLLMTPSILSGVTNTLNQQQMNTLYGNIVIDPPSTEYYLSHASYIEKKVEQIPGVRGVSSHLEGNALVEYQWKEKESVLDKGKSGTWSVIGIEPEREKNVTTIHESIIQGSYLDGKDRDEIILGVEIAGGETAQTAEFLTLQGVQVGDKVRLTYHNGVQREYRVKGIFQAKEMFQADRLAFVTKSEMASVMGRTVYSDQSSQILVSTSPGASEGQIIQEISSLGIDAEVRKWSEYGGLGGIVSSFDVLTALIGTIGLVIAGIVMFIVIYINVINKRRQIGILRAIGIKRDVIIGSYLTQSIFYAALGIVFGGLIFGYGIQPYFELHPLELPLGQVSLAVQPFTVSSAILGILVAAVLAGLVPVISITRQHIIQAIWGN